MIETAAIRVLIVDDHEGVRLGLSTALATVDDIHVVGAATSGMETLLVSSQVELDVILMEVELPDRDGIDTIRLIRQRDPRIQVVVLTAAQSADLRERAESAGARNYLQKYVPIEEIIQAIREAYTGRTARAASGELVAPRLNPQTSDQGREH